MCFLVLGKDRRRSAALVASMGPSKWRFAFRNHLVLCNRMVRLCRACARALPSGCGFFEKVLTELFDYPVNVTKSQSIVFQARSRKGCRFECGPHQLRGET